jgi:hypothetical protein
VNTQHTHTPCVACGEPAEAPICRWCYFDSIDSCTCGAPDQYCPVHQAHIIADRDDNYHPDED